MTTRWWTAAAGSARGARHALRGEPSEDAFGSSQTDEVTSIAVADGHSSYRCPRARIGAQLAVDAALEVLGNRHTSGDTATEIVRRWRRLVDQHLDSHPAAEDELAQGSNYMLYGTTLAAAAATRDRVRVFQIGDSDILLTGTSGTIIPSLRRDSQGSLVETNSLAMDDVPQRAHSAEYSVEQVDVDIVALMTDGFSSAFADSNWQEQTLEDLRARLSKLEPRQLGELIGKWCEGPASVAGDDTTLALLVDDRLFAKSAVAS